MNTMIRSMKIYFSYKKLLQCMLNIVIAILISYPGIAIFEEPTSKYYMIPILILDFDLILFLSCFFKNDLEIAFNRKLIKTTVVFKQLNRLTPIIINNFFGIMYILIILVIKYMAIKNQSGNMQSVTDTTFVLLVTVGLVSFIKILLSRMRIMIAFLIGIITLILCAVSNNYFIFLGFAKSLFYNSFSYIILCGLAINMLINLAAYIYATLDD